MQIFNIMVHKKILSTQTILNYPVIQIVNISANLNISNKLDAYLRLENLFDESYEEVFGYQPLGFGAHLGIRFRP